MKGTVTSFKVKNERQASEINSLCLGEIVLITSEGRAMVDYPGNPAGPVQARTTVDVPIFNKRNGLVNISVLLVFEGGDPQLPIITGVVRDEVEPNTSSEEQALGHDRSRLDVFIDGKKMVFDANESIELRCGKSSISLKKDGKIIVKGTHITNRASASNKIKGATVQIN